MNLGALIQVARDELPADCLIKNVQLINVLSGEIYHTHIALYADCIVGCGDYSGRTTIDANGAYAAPGFIDGHVHIESSLLTPLQFARAVLPHGTTTVIADPHEIVNVLGLAGLDYMLNSSVALPLEIFFMVPSCVPATHLETAGAQVTAADLRPYLTHPRILGLAEMMNYPGVLMRDQEVLAKIGAAHDKIIDGHAPLLSGHDLTAYCAAGITSDHESSSGAEALEKLRQGLFVMIREGSAARNLSDLLPLVSPINAANLGLVTDDRHPDFLMDEGHIDSMVRQAIHQGLEPVSAIQLATINTARHFGLKRQGAIAPGYQADLVLFDNFKDFHILKVFKKGRLVAENGKLTTEIAQPEVANRSTINLASFTIEDLQVAARSTKIRAIEIVPHQILTKTKITTPKIENGQVVADITSDLLKLVVIERHHATGNIGKAFISGFGLQRGALASSVAHDSHNIIAVGVSDSDIFNAIQALKKLGGGQVVIANGEVLAQLPLPVAGLMSDRPLEEVRQRCEQLKQAAHQLGCQLPDPFMTLSFLALPVIPELKLTDRGLVDVQRFELVDMWVA